MQHSPELAVQRDRIAPAMRANAASIRPYRLPSSATRMQANHSSRSASPMATPAWDAAEARVAKRAVQKPAQLVAHRP
jgi:hypothetical protein